MGKFYLISDERVCSSLDMLSVIGKVEEAYQLKAKKNTTLFPVITHDWIVGKKDMDIKSGVLGGNIDVYGLKALTYMESNDQLNIPRLTGTMMIFNSNDGQLKGILDSRSITGMRTGAAGAIGAKYLAREASENLLVIGTGNQAFFNLAGILLTMKNIKTVRIYDPMSKEAAEKFIKRIRLRLSDEILTKYSRDKAYPDLVNQFKVEYVVVEDIAKATKQSDIIVTVTPSRKPLIFKDWIKPGTHINCIGSDMEGKQEIDDNIFKNAKVVLDDIKQGISIGETESAIKNGIITEDDIHSEIGNIIIKDAEARTSNSEVTIFDSTGLALQDLIVANHLIDLAAKDNMKTYEL